VVARELRPLAGHVEGRVLENLLRTRESPSSPITFQALLLLRLSLPALIL